MEKSYTISIESDSEIYHNPKSISCFYFLAGSSNPLLWANALNACGCVLVQESAYPLFNVTKSPFVLSLSFQHVVSPSFKHLL